MITDIDERLSTRKSSIENKSKPVLLDSDKRPLAIRERKKFVDESEASDRKEKQKFKLQKIKDE